MFAPCAAVERRARAGVGSESYASDVAKSISQEFEPYNSEGSLSGSLLSAADLSGGDDEWVM